MTPTTAVAMPRAESRDSPPACLTRAAVPEVIPDLDSYEEIIVAFSGGKDCLASILYLLELGVPRSKIHAHHHLVDGREGSTLFDWPCTEGYCSAVCAALGIPISFSWRRGGLEQEALRNDCATAPVMIPDEYVGHRPIGGDGPSGTRLKFPQQSADLSVRWCSSVAKISCMDALITNDPRFRDGGRRLVITGERAEESPNRARYKVFEPHRSDLRRGIRYQRHVDHWRPVHAWATSDVWAIIERHRVLPHPAYFLGWGRCSCRCCVFGSNDQWATVRAIAPEQFAAVVQREREFKVTIHRKRSVEESAALGTPYATDAQWVVIANSSRFAIPVIVTDWQLPAGAYGESCGPT